MSGSVYLPPGARWGLAMLSAGRSPDWIAKRLIRRSQDKDLLRVCLPVRAGRWADVRLLRRAVRARTFDCPVALPRRLLGFY